MKRELTAPDVAAILEDLAARIRLYKPMDEMSRQRAYMLAAAYPEEYRRLASERASRKANG